MTSSFIQVSSAESHGLVMVATKSFAEGAPNYLVSLLNEQRLMRKAVSDLSCEIERFRISDDDLEIINNTTSEEHNEDQVSQAECKCCGMKEECTTHYIQQIEKSFSGKWICGLCSEAVKEKMSKFPNATIDEAISSHRDFCDNFNSTTRLNPKLSLTSSMREIAKRSCEKRNSSNLGTSKLARSISCDPRVGVLNN